MTTKKDEAPVAKVEKNISDYVLSRINTFLETGELSVPKDYSVENALKSAYLILTETLDKNKKPVLSTCTKESIANTLLDMVIQGLSPLKKQCSFIAYGNKLTMQREYAGTIALARRVGGVIGVPVGNVVYEDDEFEYSIDPETGLKKIVKHIQKFENIDINKIVGAYSIVTHESGYKHIEIMTMEQIRKAWAQGAARGSSPAHQNFTDQMALKTCLSRACKLFISTSNDATAFDSDGEIENTVIDTSRKMIAENANREVISFDDIKEEVSENLTIKDEQPPVKEAPNQPKNEEKNSHEDDLPWNQK